MFLSCPLKLQGGARHHLQRRALAVRERAIVVCYITDDSWRKCHLLDHGYKAVAMTLEPAAMLCAGCCTLTDQKRSKRVEYFGSIHTLPPHPDQEGDVCKVRLRSVQKCGFV